MDNQRINSEIRISDNDPPYSRIFVVCAKNLTEEDLPQIFGQFGAIQYCKLLREKSTGESKGLAYVKFEKTSSAAEAIEKMNGKIPREGTSPLKVTIAEAKGAPRQSYHQHTYPTDPEDTPPRSRLFITCAKELTEDKILQAFRPYGEIEYCKLIKDKKTGEPKGFAYVKFSSATTAAKAMEEVSAKEEIDSHKVKVVIAEPKSARFEKQEQASYPPVPPPIYSYPEYTSYPPSGYNPNFGSRLFVVCHRSITQDQLYHIFGRTPGIEFVDLKRDKTTGESRGFAYISYANPQAAIMAKESMDGFEFPPGHSLKVTFAEPAGRAPNPPPPLPPQPTMSDMRNYPEGSRLYIVVSRQAPEYLLQDIFVRFGALEYVRMKSDKNFGYVKYTTAEAAKYAMQYLNGTELHGIRFKVSIANPPSRDPSSQPTAPTRRH